MTWEETTRPLSGTSIFIPPVFYPFVFIIGWPGWTNDTTDDPDWQAGDDAGATWTPIARNPTEWT